MYTLEIKKRNLSDVFFFLVVSYEGTAISAYRGEDLAILDYIKSLSKDFLYSPDSIKRDLSAQYDHNPIKTTSDGMYREAFVLFDYLDLMPMDIDFFPNNLKTVCSYKYGTHGFQPLCSSLGMNLSDDRLIRSVQLKNHSDYAKVCEVEINNDQRGFAQIMSKSSALIYSDLINMKGSSPRLAQFIYGSKMGMYISSNYSTLSMQKRMIEERLMYLPRYDDVRVNTWLEQIIEFHKHVS